MTPTQTTTLLPYELIHVPSALRQAQGRCRGKAWAIFQACTSHFEKNHPRLRLSVERRALIEHMNSTSSAMNAKLNKLYTQMQEANAPSLDETFEQQSSEIWNKRAPLIRARLRQWLHPLFCRELRLCAEKQLGHVKQDLTHLYDLPITHAIQTIHSIEKEQEKPLSEPDKAALLSLAQRSVPRLEVLVDNTIMQMIADTYQACVITKKHEFCSETLKANITKAVNAKLTDKIAQLRITLKEHLTSIKHAHLATATVTNLFDRVLRQLSNNHSLNCPKEIRDDLFELFAKREVIALEKTISDVHRNLLSSLPPKQGRNKAIPLRNKHIKNESTRITKALYRDIYDTLVEMAFTERKEGA